MKRTIAAIGVLLLTLCIAPAASATYLTYQLGFSFSGTPPAGPGPWMRAQFDDSFGPNTVRLTMTAIGLIDQENCGLMFFNFTPAVDPSALTFNRVPASEVTVNGVYTGSNALKADGDGFYDIMFDFAPPPGSFGDRFTAGESVVYDISADGLTLGAFNYVSSPGGGTGLYYSAAHIQSINGGGDSDWIGDEDGDGEFGGGGGEVPEPASLLLVGLVLAGASGIGFLNRRRR